MFNQKPIVVLENQCDVAWLAGLLEGEGSFQISAHNSIILSVEMTDEDIIQRVSILLNTSYALVKPRKAHFKTSYRLQIKGSRAAAIMSQILPFMGERRSKKIKECTEFFSKALEVRLNKMATKTLRIPDERLQDLWEQRDKSKSFRAFARSIDATHEGIRRRLIIMGLYVPSKNNNSRLKSRIENRKTIARLTQRSECPPV